MMEYTVKRVTGKPVWAQIEEISMDNRYLDTKDDVSASAKLCYDDEALYVRMSTTEPETRSKETGPLCEPCLDSCLEFFFSPVLGDDRYLNIEFNSRGAYFFGIGSNIKDLIRLIPNGNPHVFSARISRRNDGWSITYKIPHNLVKRLFPLYDPAPGNTIRANFYKCSEAAEEPNFLSWSRVEGRILNFHRPNCFGKIIFE